MLLRGVRAENFRGFREIEIAEIPAPAVISVEGADGAALNVLRDLVAYAFFGRLHDGSSSPDEIISPGADYAWVEVDFDHATSGAGSLRRGVTAAGAVKVSLREAGRVSGDEGEVAAAVVGLFGLDAEEFERIYLEPGRGGREAASSWEEGLRELREERDRLDREIGAAETRRRLAAKHLARVNEYRESLEELRGALLSADVDSDAERAGPRRAVAGDPRRHLGAAVALAGAAVVLSAVVPVLRSALDPSPWVDVASAFLAVVVFVTLLLAMWAALTYSSSGRRADAGESVFDPIPLLDRIEEDFSDVIPSYDPELATSLEGRQRELSETIASLVGQRERLDRALGEPGPEEPAPPPAVTEPDLSVGEETVLDTVAGLVPERGYRTIRQENGGFSGVAGEDGEEAAIDRLSPLGRTLTFALDLERGRRTLGEACDRRFLVVDEPALGVAPRGAEALLGFVGRIDPAAVQLVVLARPGRSPAESQVVAVASESEGVRRISLSPTTARRAIEESGPQRV